MYLPIDVWLLICNNLNIEDVKIICKIKNLGVSPDRICNHLVGNRFTNLYHGDIVYNDDHGCICKHPNGLYSSRISEINSVQYPLKMIHKMYHYHLSMMPYGSSRYVYFHSDCKYSFVLYVFKLMTILNDAIIIKNISNECLTNNNFTQYKRYRTLHNTLINMLNKETVLYLNPSLDNSYKGNVYCMQ